RLVTQRDRVHPAHVEPVRDTELQCVPADQDDVEVARAWPLGIECLLAAVALARDRAAAEDDVGMTDRLAQRREELAKQVGIAAGGAGGGGRPQGGREGGGR